MKNVEKENIQKQILKNNIFGSLSLNYYILVSSSSQKLTTFSRTLNLH